MSLPGLLIEYLVTGATAFLWLFVLLQLPVPGLEFHLDKLDLKSVALLAPLAYVLGMIIDFVSRIVTWLLDFLFIKHLGWPLLLVITTKLPKRFESFERWVKACISQTATISPAQIMLSSTELGQQLEMRSSRDRIARGAFLNAIIGILVLREFYSTHPNLGVTPNQVLWIGLPFVVMLFFMWYRFEFLTFRYQAKAGEIIQHPLPTIPLIATTSALVDSGAEHTSHESNS